MFSYLFSLYVVKTCAWVDSLNRVLGWLNCYNSSCVKEDSGGSDFYYAICFGLSRYVITGVFVYSETMCTQQSIENFCDRVVPFT